MLPMTIELVTAFWLAVVRPFGLPGWMLWLGAGLVVVMWASTALLRVPAHSALSGGFDAAVHDRLVTTNWLRTAAWTARAVLVVAMLASLLGPGD